MDERRPKPPADVALALRQEAKFGCCRCGFPFFDYHHIVPWSVEEHFRVEDMMILCPNCHRMATHGGLTEREQRRFKLHPHNVRKGYASGLVRLADGVPAVNIGGTVLVNHGPVLAFGDEPVLSLGSNEESGLSVSLTMKDRDGRVLLLVQDNEWMADGGTWDLETGYRWMRLRERRHRVTFELNGTTWPIHVRGSLWEEGRHIFLGPQGLSFGGAKKSVQFHNVTFAATYLAFDLFRPSPGGDEIKLRTEPDPRYREGKFLAGTSNDVLEKAIAHLLEVKAERSVCDGDAKPPHDEVDVTPTAQGPT